MESEGTNATTDFYYILVDPGRGPGAGLRVLLSADHDTQHQKSTLKVSTFIGLMIFLWCDLIVTHINKMIFSQVQERVVAYGLLKRNVCMGKISILLRYNFL